ncbi:MAG: VCBS repeat-containing protein [Acidobacteriota bacterium]
MLFAQGIASRGVRAVPRGKPGGLPYYGRFVNVAAQAGLRQVVHYGRADYDGDGDTDFFLTFWEEQRAVLQHRQSEFRRRHDRQRPRVETRFVGWGAAVDDFDTDGRPDLSYVTGSVYPEMEAKLPAFPFRTPAVLFRGLGHSDPRASKSCSTRPGRPWRKRTPAGARPLATTTTTAISTC